MKTMRTAVLSVSVLALAGCVNLAPDYKRGAPSMPAQLPVDPAASSGSAALHWEDIVVAAPLRELIAVALIALVLLQVTLGVLNVKLALPLVVAVMHSGGAVALLFVLVTLLARLRAPE